MWLVQGSGCGRHRAHQTETVLILTFRRTSSTLISLLYVCQLLTYDFQARLLLLLSLLSVFARGWGHSVIYLLFLLSELLDVIF